eukprot:jgi/Mesvir1/27176/Mv18964-RA.1
MPVDSAKARQAAAKQQRLQEMGERVISALRQNIRVAEQPSSRNDSEPAAVPSGTDEPAPAARDPETVALEEEIASLSAITAEQRATIPSMLVEQFRQHLHSLRETPPEEPPSSVPNPPVGNPSRHDALQTSAVAAGSPSQHTSGTPGPDSGPEQEPGQPSSSAAAGEPSVSVPVCSPSVLTRTAASLDCMPPLRARLEAALARMERVMKAVESQQYSRDVAGSEFLKALAEEIPPLHPSLIGDTSGAGGASVINSGTSGVTNNASSGGEGAAEGAAGTSSSRKRKAAVAVSGPPSVSNLPAGTAAGQGAHETIPGMVTRRQLARKLQSYR